MVQDLDLDLDLLELEELEELELLRLQVAAAGGEKRPRGWMDGWVDEGYSA